MEMNGTPTAGETMIQNLPEPKVWETRQNYNQRTSLALSSVRWTALVGYTVEKTRGRAA